MPYDECVVSRKFGKISMRKQAPFTGAGVATDTTVVAEWIARKESGNRGSKPDYSSRVPKHPPRTQG